MNKSLTSLECHQALQTPRCNPLLLHTPSVTELLASGWVTAVIPGMRFTGEVIHLY